MVTSRILLFGNEEQVDNAFKNKVLPDDWLLRCEELSPQEFIGPGNIGKAFQEFNPDVVVSVAGWGDVEACEQNRELAENANFHAVVQIAAQCDTISAPLIHLSTDYVFDGENNGVPFGPDDAMNPLNIYGQTKMLGEEAVRHGLYWHVILRTSRIFSAYGDNILTRMLREIDTQDEVKGMADQMSCPTSVDAVADALIKITGEILHGKGNGFGTFHVGGQPPVNHFDFLCAVMDAYAPFTERRPKLVPISASDIPDRAPRPAYSVLNTDRTRDVYGIEPRQWRDDLVKAVRQYAKSRE